MKLIRHLALAAAAFAAGMVASAEDAACPADAATMLYQVAAAAGQTSDPAQLNVAYSHAAQLSQLCPQDPFVQFFAAHTFTQVAARIQDPASRLQSLTDATKALFGYDKLGTADSGGPVFRSGLTYEDGSEAVVDTVASGRQLLTDLIVRHVVDLEARGQFHPFVSSRGQTADAPCPYSTPGWVEAEVAGYEAAYRAIAPYYLDNGAAPNSMGAIGRMEWLAKVCPDSAETVTYELGRMSVQAAGWYDELGDPETASGAAADAVGWLTKYKTLVEARGGTTSATAGANLMISDMRALGAE
ncbi:MAG: hypothetical protein R3C13_13635 [Hyphomonas sp.]|uniref:hypothetical protein n=1 Tax=Hyphomonas sp. TaxID=87 RepID=UPI0035288728